MRCTALCISTGQSMLARDMQRVYPSINGGLNMGDKSDGADHGQKTREKIRVMINEVACCPKNHYCTLKEILCRAPRQAREILQIKCVEKFKYERSEREQREIDWPEAFDVWIDEGYAAVFARVFQEGIPFADVYRAVVHNQRTKEIE